MKDIAIVNYHSSLYPGTKVLSKGHPLMNTREISEDFIYCRVRGTNAIMHSNSAKKAALCSAGNAVMLTGCERKGCTLTISSTMEVMKRE